MRQLRLTQPRPYGKRSQAIHSALLTCRDGRRVLIDAGSEGEAQKLQSELADLGVFDVLRGGQFIEIDATMLH